MKWGERMIRTGCSRKRREERYKGGGGLGERLFQMVGVLGK